MTAVLLAQVIAAVTCMGAVLGGLIGLTFVVPADKAGDPLYALIPLVSFASLVLGLVGLAILAWLWARQVQARASGPTRKLADAILAVVRTIGRIRLVVAPEGPPKVGSLNSEPRVSPGRPDLAGDAEAEQEFIDYLERPDTGLAIKAIAVFEQVNASRKLRARIAAWGALKKELGSQPSKAQLDASAQFLYDRHDTALDVSEEQIRSYLEAFGFVPPPDMPRANASVRERGIHGEVKPEQESDRQRLIADIAAFLATTSEADWKMEPILARGNAKDLLSRAILQIGPDSRLGVAPTEGETPMQSHVGALRRALALLNGEQPNDDGTPQAPNEEPPPKSPYAGEWATSDEPPPGWNDNHWRGRPLRPCPYCGFVSISRERVTDHLWTAHKTPPTDRLGGTIFEDRQPWTTQAINYLGPADLNQAPRTSKGRAKIGVTYWATRGTADHVVKTGKWDYGPDKGGDADAE